MTPKLKKIIITLLILIILFVVYAVFIKKDPTADSLLGSNGATASSDAQALGNQISQALLRIEQIKLDRGIFDNDIYKTLTDRSEPITEEPIGRANPFAPIGEVSVSSSARTTATASSTKVQATSTPPTSSVPSGDN